MLFLFTVPEIFTNPVGLLRGTSQETVRNLWRDACLNMTDTGLIDGCGADAGQQNGSNIIGLSAETLAAWAPAHVEAQAAATAAVSAQGGFILGKMAFQLGVSTNGVLQV